MQGASQCLLVVQNSALNVRPNWEMSVKMLPQYMTLMSCREIPATFAESFLRVAALTLHSSIIQTRVPPSPDFLKPFSFRPCSVYFGLRRFNAPLCDPAFLLPFVGLSMVLFRPAVRTACGLRTLQFIRPLSKPSPALASPTILISCSFFCISSNPES